MTQIPEVLSCLLTKDKETGRWLGHCLDFDVVTSGKTPDWAWKHLRAVVKVHIEHCFRHNEKGLKFRAARPDWEMFEMLKSEQKFLRSEKITLTLVPPETPGIPVFWIQSVEQGAENECHGETGATLQAVH